MSTFLELQNLALHDDFDAIKYRARAKTYLNQALHRVARRVKLPERVAWQLIDTVADDNFYTLVSSVVRVESLHFFSEPGSLEQVEMRDIDDAPIARGRPTNYAFNGTGITLYPTPDAVYSLELRHWSNATDLSDDTDDPGIPDDYEDLLVTFARAKLFRDEDDAEMYAFYMSQFEVELGHMRADVQNRGGAVKRTPNVWAGRSSPQFVRPT